MKKYYVLLALSLFLVQCSHVAQKQNTQNVGPNSVAPHNLTRAEAIERAGRLSDINYNLSVVLKEDQKDFTGLVTTTFILRDASKPLSIDFYGGQVLALSVNGNETKSYEYNGASIKIPGGSFREGINNVTVNYEHPFSTSGTGLHRFEDPEDYKIYTYTHFEPYDANQFFPCFDQPDLKARYIITAEVPASWQVISSRREEKILNQGNGRKLWVFPPSEIFSTYLISLHAGPYKVWTSHAGQIPLRLFARQALAKYVNTSDWFSPTQAGLQFYGKYFDYAYPFKKYDEVIAPDFNAGAMENVAAITFSERYIKRGKPTQEDREHIASVILHEMAHMWFGDLVTMKWWNDLWLNESFATFMSATSMDLATPFKKSWQSFFLSDKQWAYWEDQLITTHPIEATVPDTDQAFANFDGITYGKGASVLKQLAFYIGEDNFKKGVQNYFKKYAFKNAELKDFIGELEASSQMDLSNWTAQWLQTAGLNSLKADLQCNEGKIAHLTLIQSAPQDLPTLRGHRTEIGLFKETESGKIEVAKTLQATYGPQPTEVKEAVGEPCPALVYPNLNDHDYVKVQLDEPSLKMAQTGISNIVDPFPRSMLWASLWDMVRESQYSVKDYANLVLSQLPKEKEFKVVGEVLTTVYGGRRTAPNILLYLPRATDGDKKELESYIEKFENLTWAGFKDGKDTDLQKSYFDAFAHLAQTPGAQQKLLSVLQGKIHIPGFTLDQDRRWEAIVQINTFDAELGKKLTQQEMKHDSSNSGKLMAIASEAARPNADVKKEWLNKITGPNNMPFNQVRYAMWNLFPLSQENLRAQFSQTFFQDLPQVVKTKDEEFQSTFSGSLAPATCSDASTNELGQAIKGGSDFTPIVMKNLKIARQEDERCIRVRGFAAQNSGK